MKMLFVEDDPSFLQDVVPKFTEIVGAANLTVAKSKRQALEAIDAFYFDLFVIDLCVPTNDGALDEAVAHGQAVFHHIVDVSPGSLVYFLTASSVEDVVTDMFHRADKVDLWGDGCSVVTVDCMSKSKLPELVAAVKRTAAIVKVTDEIEIVSRDSPVALRTEEQRILRVFTRRHGGVQCRIKPMSSGLSGAKALMIAVQNASGGPQMQAIGKIGTLAHIEDEAKRFKMVERLEAGAFPHRIDVIQAGTRRCAGVFYRLAAGFERTLFDLIAADSARAASLVGGLEDLFRPWRDARMQTTKKVADVRRALLSDETVEGLMTEYGLTWIPEFEARQLQVNWQCIHGDLHAGNVLVRDDDVPLLIDFGDVAESASGIDAVMLELSPLFHPDGAALRKRWPSAASAAGAWSHCEAFTQDCPFADYIRACRAFADQVAAGPREVQASAYAYVLRQLKYPDTDKALALQLLNGIRFDLDASYGG